MCRHLDWCIQQSRRYQQLRTPYINTYILRIIHFERKFVLWHSRPVATILTDKTASAKAAVNKEDDVHTQMPTMAPDRGALSTSRSPTSYHTHLVPGISLNWLLQRRVRDHWNEWKCPWKPKLHNRTRANGHFLRQTFLPPYPKAEGEAGEFAIVHNCRVSL